MLKRDLISKTFSAQLSEKKRRSSVRWATINLLGIAVIFADILSTDEIYIDSKAYFYYIEVAAVTILSLSFISNFFTFLYHTFFVDKIVCDNESQKILLNLSNKTMVMSSPAAKPVKPGNANDSFNSVQNLSFQKYGDATSNSINSSYNLNNSGWMSPNTSNQLNNSMNRDKSTIDANSFSSPSKFKSSDFIQDKSSMEHYLQEFSQHEKEIASAIEAQHNMSGYVGSNFNSFWGNYRFDEIIASLKTSIYSLSPHNNKQNPLDENYMSKHQENNSEIIRKMCANKLSIYTANLKIWISKTILEPIVQAIDEVDKSFQQRGFTDMKIGTVGLERLKKVAASNHHLIANIPMLPKLIPYLELTANQEYLVGRIRELAKGSCLKNFKFNSNLLVQPDQPDNIPSDAGIIFHLFCTYLDSQLHPSPDIPRSFYSRYVLIGDVKKMNSEHLMKEVTRNKAKCGILCSSPTNPKFNFISADKVHTSSYDRNNLFYVVIQFVMHLRMNDENLESVGLGKSGINILNVIED